MHVPTILHCTLSHYNCFFYLKHLSVFYRLEQLVETLWL